MMEYTQIELSFNWNGFIDVEKIISKRTFIPNTVALQFNTMHHSDLLT